MACPVDNLEVGGRMGERRQPASVPVVVKFGRALVVSLSRLEQIRSVLYQERHDLRLALAVASSAPKKQSYFLFVPRSIVKRRALRLCDCIDFRSPAASGCMFVSHGREEQEHHKNLTASPCPVMAA
eukprot:754826-Hanusia_phi.AAC.6